MSNFEKYLEVFTRMFAVGEDEAKNLKYQDIAAWDSVGHMTLVSELEDTFGIEMDADDIIDFSSFEKGIEIMKKYDVDIS